MNVLVHYGPMSRCQTHHDDGKSPPNLETRARSRPLKSSIFYDRYPYPRPVDNLENYGRLWKERQRRLADFHLFWPAQIYREDFSILIAGCGTSQAAKYAMRWPQAQVTGIDFSATSLRRTEELKRKHNLKPIYRCINLPWSGQASWKRVSIRSSAQGFSTTWSNPMRASARYAVCSNQAARCSSWFTLLTDERASTCCRISAEGSVSPHRMKRFGTWSLR